MNSVEIGLQHRHGLMVLAAHLVEQQKQIGTGKFPQTPAAEPALLHLAVDAAGVMIEADRKIGRCRLPSDRPWGCPIPAS